MSCDTTDETVYVAIDAGQPLLLTVDLDAISGGEIDITGWTWLAPISDAALSMTVTPTDLLKGVLELSLTVEQTTAMTPGDYDWTLRATDASSAERTLITGRLRIREGS